MRNTISKCGVTYQVVYRIIERGNSYAYQIQKMRQDEVLLRTNSYDRIDNNSGPELGIGDGSLFISGNSAPICLVKEKRKPRPQYKAPLPKTRRSGKEKENKNVIPPIHGFGCTNLRYSNDSVLINK